jgi:methyl-accepting chemotaxis protein
MFARLYAFFTIVGVTLVTAVVIHKLRFPFVPEFIRPTVEYGFLIYLMVVLIIAVLSLIFTRFVTSSMTQLDKSFHKSKEQNSVMQNVITGISQTSTRMTSLGKELNHTSEQVALNAETQAAQIEEISSEMEEMTGIVLNNSENAELSFKVFKESAEQLKRSSETIIKAVELINSISERTQHISDIAFQTNILALNASIESAKAKRFGAGFSVVADEVRKLATKSNSVSDEISNLTKLSFQITESLQKEMIENLAKSQETLSLIETISASGREQTMAIKSVNSAVQKLAEISTLNADSATKMNLFARELSQLSESSKQISQNVASAKK